MSGIAGLIHRDFRRPVDERLASVLVTGTGLKTPNVVETRPGREIDADVDVLLDALGVAV